MRDDKQRAVARQCTMDRYSTDQGLGESMREIIDFLDSSGYRLLSGSHGRCRGDIGFHGGILMPPTETVITNIVSANDTDNDDDFRAKI